MVAKSPSFSYRLPGLHEWFGPKKNIITLHLHERWHALHERYESIRVGNWFFLSAERVDFILSYTFTFNTACTALGFI